VVISGTPNAVRALSAKPAMWPTAHSAQAVEQNDEHSQRTPHRACVARVVVIRMARVM